MEKTREARLEVGYRDLRDWLERAEGMGNLRRVKGADWNLELGTISELNVKRKEPPALLFDEIKDYPRGYRVLTCSMCNAANLGLTLGLPTDLSDQEMVQALRGKPLEWEAQAEEFSPQFMDTGPILENVLTGDQVDLLRLPAPFWHELDGGRYLGTGNAVITQDPDTGDVNLGTYRVMIHDNKTTGISISPGKHARAHLAKYHSRGQPAPIAISLGHDPLFLLVASSEVPLGVSEYNYAGAIRGKPIPVIKGRVTGLPIPAYSEIAIEGWCPAQERRIEGPFGEWTGYYAGGAGMAGVIHVEAIYHRNDPIILGCPPNKPPQDMSYYHAVFRSVLLSEALAKAGVPDVKGVWCPEAGGNRLLLVVSIRQRYAGHARQAGFVASQCQVGAYMGRYVIVVDDDIDPSNMNDVIWALCTRSNPEADIDIIRRAWAGPADPLIRGRHRANFNSRAIIDACRPFEWMEEFPKVSESSPELAQRVREKWREVLGS